MWRTNNQMLWRRLQAVICLLPLLAVHTQVLPALVALGATIEGSHTTYLGIDSNGFRIVLSHERGNVARPDYLPGHRAGNAAHRHGIASSLVCLTGGFGGQLDHSATFSSGTVTEQRGGGEPAADAPLFSEIPSLASSGSAPLRFVLNPAPADFPFTLEAVRTTVLLL